MQGRHICNGREQMLPGGVQGCKMAPMHIRFVHPIAMNVVNWAVMDDLFDSSVNLEESHFKEGYDEGYSHGLVSGRDEGKQVGLKVGFEVGEELGFYSGCIHIWTSAIQVDPTCFSSRAKAAIAQMQDLIGKYPLMDPEDLQVREIMDTLRVKFKMLCSSLHVKLNYNGYPAEANDIQF